MKPKPTIIKTKAPRGPSTHLGDIHAMNVARLKLHGALEYGSCLQKEYPNEGLYTLLVSAKLMLQNEERHNIVRLSNEAEDIYQKIAHILESK
jgi:hypothetical protein